MEGFQNSPSAGQAVAFGLAAPIVFGVFAGFALFLGPNRKNATFIAVCYNMGCLAYSLLFVYFNPWYAYFGLRDIARWASLAPPPVLTLVVGLVLALRTRRETRPGGFAVIQRRKNEGGTNRK